MGRLGIKINKNAFAAGKEKMKESGDFNDVELPPGRYVCIIRRAKAQTVKDLPKVIFDLEVAGEAEQAGGRISVWQDLSEDKIHHLMRTLEKLGYDMEGLDEDKLADILDDIENTTPVVRVTAKHKGDYNNYYIDKKLEELTAADVESGGESAAAPEEAAEPAPAPAPKAKAKAAPAAPAAKAKAKPAPEPEPEAEAEAEEDQFAGMDRTALKAFITTNELGIVVNKGMTDDVIREKIRETIAEAPAAEEAEAEAEAPADDEVAIAPGLKCKATIKGKVVDVTVVSVDEDAGTVEVKGPTGKVKIPVAQLSL